MRLLLIRHGESNWNKRNIVQGIKNPHLSKQGRKQSERIAYHLRNHSFEKFYTSPLLRAFQTTKIISAYHPKVPICSVNDLVEIRLGEWEGKSLKTVSRQYNQLFSTWYEVPTEVRIPGGEDVLTFKERVVKTFDNVILNNNHKGDVCVVAHGGVISIYLTHLLEMNIDLVWRISLKNTALTIVEYNGKWINLTLFNDTCHLEPSMITW